MSDRAALRRRHAAATLLLLVATLVPRVVALDRAGPFMWDDGIHLLEARWIVTGARALGESSARWLEERRTGQDLWRFEPERERLAAATEGMPLLFPRPAYPTAIAAVAALTGRGVEWAARVLSAFAGAATVPLVWLIGTRCWDRRSGWLAAMALALAGYHVAYSRMALAEAPSVLVVCAAFTPLLARRRGDTRVGVATLIGVGTLWGLACLFQDRLLPFTVLPVLLAWRVARRGDPRDRLGILAMVAAVGAPVALLQALAELPYYLAMLALQHFLAPLPFPTHVERLLTHYAQGLGVSGFRPENLPTYPFLFGVLLGPALAALVAVGVVRAASRRWRGGAAGDVLSWLVLPLAPASLTAAGSRYAVVALPAAALLAGWVAAHPELWLPRVRALQSGRGYVATLAVVALATLPFALAPIGWSSGHAAAARVLDDWGVRCVVSSQPFVTAVELGLDRVEAPPRGGHELEDRGRRCDAHLVDALGAVLREQDATTAAWVRELDARVPDRVIANPAASSMLFPFEYNFSLTRTLEYLAGPERRRAGEIRLYRDAP